MSIKKIEMFTIVCDNCKKSADEGTDYFCWNDENFAKEVAIDSVFISENDSHYCSKCYDYNNEDELIINTERKK